MVVYRLLTAGSVEIEMMERQISKKKLERLAVYGGDYRQAGKRAGSELTLSTIRKLLEDDVKNLGRMSSSAATTAAAALSSLTGGKEGVRQSDNKAAINNAHVEIDPKELSMIMNRDLLFVKTVKSTSASVRGPTPTSVVATMEDDSFFANSPTVSSAKLQSSASAKKSAAKAGKSGSSPKQVSSPKAATQAIDTTSASASSSSVVYGGGGTAQEVLGSEEDRLVTYEVSSSVPLEGAMYDIICIDPNQISGMLQGFNA